MARGTSCCRTLAFDLLTSGEAIWYYELCARKPMHAVKDPFWHFTLIRAVDSSCSNSYYRVSFQILKFANRRHLSFWIAKLDHSASYWHRQLEQSTKSNFRNSTMHCKTILIFQVRKLLTVTWPSGLRRGTQVAVRKSVGSNPTVTKLLPVCL